MSWTDVHTPATITVTEVLDVDITSKHLVFFVAFSLFLLSPRRPSPESSVHLPRLHCAKNTDCLSSAGSDLLITVSLPAGLVLSTV